MLADAAPVTVIPSAPLDVSAEMASAHADAPELAARELTVALPTKAQDAVPDCLRIRHLNSQAAASADERAFSFR